jgi:hypothetical protein
MAARRPRAVLAGALALCALALWTPPSLAGRSPSVRYAAHALLGGVNIAGLEPSSTPAQADRDMAWARRLHAKVVRVELPWSLMEPAGPGQLDPRALAFSDRLLADGAAEGVKVILMVDSSPCWASSAPARVLRRCVPRRPGPANAWAPRDPATYAAFVAFLAQRYGPGLAALEVWNEPDQGNEHYLAGPGKAAHYAGILRAAYPAIKHADPSVTVLGGSLVGSNGAFLRALYAAGIKGFYDGLSVHFYNLTLASLRSIHEAQLAAGDPAPLWLDEFGWSSCWPRYRIQQEQACVTKRLQGADLRSMYRSLASAPYVAAAVMYKLQGSTSEDFGVLTGRGARKPAFSDLAHVLAAPGGSPGGVSLGLRRSGGHVLATGTAPPGDFMRIEVLQGATLRFFALFTLDRFNSYSIALPGALGVSGLTVRVYQYWLGPSHAAQRSI